MKHTPFSRLFLILFFAVFAIGEAAAHRPHLAESDVAQLLARLQVLAKNEKDPLLKRHFESLMMITSDTSHGLSMQESDLQAATEALAFFNAGGENFSTYLAGPRPLIMAYQSPADGKNSYYWLFLPKNFDRKKKDYPLYMEIHGSGGGKNNQPWKMLYHYLKPTEAPGTSQMYLRDGFMIYPWGRGDKGYDGIAFTDLEESLADFDAMFTTDPNRQYLYGFSMGGKGVYKLALSHPERWTALGIYSGIMQSTPEEVETIKHIPIWMTWGETERWCVNNRTLRDHLLEAGAEPSWEEQAGVGHSYNGEYQAAMMKWFLKQRKN